MPFRSGGVSAYNAFLDYNNTGTGVGTPAGTSVSPSVWYPLANDGLGAFTNTGYGAGGVTSLLASSGNLDFSQLSLGDAVLVRFDFTVTPGHNGGLLEMRLKLGAGAGEYFLPRVIAPLSNGAGIPYRFVETIPVYMGDENTRGNEGELQLKCSQSFTVEYAGFYAQLMLQGA